MKIQGLTGLFLSIPESVNEIFGVYSTSNLDRFTILGDFDTVELFHEYLDATVYLAQGGEGAMGRVVSQELNTFCVCEFDLSPCEYTYRINEISERRNGR